MNVSAANINPVFTASGTLPISHPGVSNPSVTHIIGLGSTQRTPTTTPPTSKSWEGVVTLSAGAATLDLTALPYGTLSAVDLTGLKINAIHLFAHATNTAPITVAPGLTNPYDPDFDTLVLQPRDEVIIRKHLATLPAVASGVKTLDFTGTLAEEISVHILAG